MHLRQACLAVHRVPPNVADGEQQFELGNVARGIGILHLVPERGDRGAPIRAEIGMQAPNEKSIQLLHAGIERRCLLVLFRVEQNARLLSRVRESLGRVESRALRTGREQQSAAAPLSGHALELVYATRFERGSATEKFTLLERGGEWLLAGYSVNSDVLKANP